MVVIGQDALAKEGGPAFAAAVVDTYYSLNRILNEIEGVEDGVFMAPEDLDRNPAARLAAFVVAPSRSAEEILAALRERVEAVFLPRPVVMLDALPRDGVGKLSRRALAALRQRPA